MPLSKETKQNLIGHVYIYPNTLLPAGYVTKSITAGWISVFSFSKTGCLTKAKEPILLYYLIITGRERTNGFIPFLRALAQSEMQTALFKI